MGKDSAAPDSLGPRPMGAPQGSQMGLHAGITWGAFTKHRCLGPTPRDAALIGLGYSLGLRWFKSSQLNAMYRVRNKRLKRLGLLALEKQLKGGEVRAPLSSQCSRSI